MRGCALATPFFFPLAFAVYAESSVHDPCSFSLRQENPKHLQFTVQSGRIGFLCKSEGFFLRGTVTRTLGWQLTGKIFETMADRLKAETLEKWPSGRLYRIANEKQNTQKSLICGYHTRDKYSLDLCAPEGHEGSLDSDRAYRLVYSVLTEFRKIPLEESPLLKSAPLYSQKKVFNEENETREPALLALMMPSGYVEVTRRDNRSLFTDAAGLAEIEIFYEISELALDSELAHKVYRKSITAFLAKQGSWREENAEAPVRQNDASCLIFSDSGTRLSHYCYAVIPITVAGKKKFCRIAFVAAFLRDAVDRSKLLAEQFSLLNEWAAVIRRHTN